MDVLLLVTFTPGDRRAVVVNGSEVRSKVTGERGAPCITSQVEFVVK